MYKSEKKVTIEWVNATEKTNKSNYTSLSMSNPINRNQESDKIASMVNTILNEEFPELINNSLIHDLVLYNVLQKVDTVQTVENVLSCMKTNRAKQINDVYFKNGEVRIKCSI